ncbi:MAG: hypothetical protein ALECFALPRED_006613 [Alectoria fallacina]|uniref:Uncharacterized protein n=1 Tax=Alectoria fallacina TaxID=1903189 RepID=A0A8H3EPX4_9LECA|nr:MAG: hypothetical protein ALECFALPRED_006613 [Alectoria fallacina]
MDRLCFEPKINTVVQCYQRTVSLKALNCGSALMMSKNSDLVQHEVQKLPDYELRAWLRKAPDHSTNEAPVRGMRIVISYRASDASIQPNDPGAETLSHLPFSRETFLEIMDHFHLSHSFVRTVLRGGLHFSSNILNAPPYPHPFRCFNMRMDNSWSRDLAMAASANIGTGMTYALFHGCDEQDVKVLMDWLKITICSAGHPLLLPAFFAELQLRRQYRNHSPGAQPASLQKDAFDYDNTTREVLGMYQDTGFLETGLTKLRRGLKQMEGQLAAIRITVPETQADFIAKESVRIGDRLEEMMDDYEGLIAECRLITDGASLLNNAVSPSSYLPILYPKPVSD